MGDQLSIELESAPDEAAQIILVSGLVAYNESRVGPDPVRQSSNHLCLLGRNADGMVKAGLQAVVIDAWEDLPVGTKVAILHLILEARS